MNRFSEFYKQRVKRGLVRRLNNLKIARVAKRVARQSPPPSGAPIAFFKASTGIDDLSWNSGFHLLASCALRLKGIPVAYFGCHSGMSHCVLGTNRESVRKSPPCKSCIYQSETLYAGLPRSNDFSRSSQQATKVATTSVYWFDFHRDAQLASTLENFPLRDLMSFEWQSIPLGKLCIPGLRWILRIHHLKDDESTRYLLREYILSAWNVAQKFSKFLDETNPRAVVVFNGQFYPEATALYIARQRGIRVITHEVGLQPASAFFTDGEATAYPIAIPESFELNAEQNAKLDAYLAKRFQGDFSMAGIKFWTEMKGLDEA